jgi:hypothetical protein
MFKRPEKKDPAPHQFQAEPDPIRREEEVLLTRELHGNPVDPTVCFVCGRDRYDPVHVASELVEPPVWG